jgi:hypothetical protein
VQRIALAALLTLCVALPRAASAEIRIRGGLEAPIVTHISAGGGTTSTIFADGISPAINVMLSAYAASLIGFDAEFRTYLGGNDKIPRQGTFIGPGLTLNPPILPIYVRGSVPIQVEGPGSVRVDLRGAAGLSFNLLLLSIYLEGALDFPLAGDNVTAFNSQQFSLGGGVWFKF